MLDRALKVIQEGMLKNNPAPVKSSVGAAVQVLGSLLNTHKCLVESWTEIQKQLDSLPTIRKAFGLQMPRSASLGDTPKLQLRGKKRQASSTPEDRTSKKGKSGTPPSSYAEAGRRKEEEEEEEKNEKGGERNGGKKIRAPLGGGEEGSTEAPADR